MSSNNNTLDFKSLCNKFDLMINMRRFEEADKVINQIETRYPKEKNTSLYYKVIMSYYLDRDNSFKQYDSLFFSRNLYTCEGYYYSVKIEASSKERISINLGNNWNPLNPSIIRNDNNFTLNIRCSNYQILPGGRYVSLDSDKVIRTRNLIRVLDNNFRVIEEYELIQPDKCTRKDGFGIKGFEDIRLFMFNSTLCFSSATYDTHRLNVQRMVMGNIIDKEIVNVNNLDIPNQKKGTEKNWLPYEENGKLLFIYSCNPFLILDCTDHRNIKLHSCDRKDIINLKHFRGSCPPIKYNLGYLFVIHQVYTRKDNSKVYVQRLVYQENNKIKSFSHQFYFEQLQIEFCSGMCQDQNNDFVFTFGIEDVAAYIYRVKKEVIDEMIKQNML